jgi:uncharacterized repeat protein (TIGR01451 family)
MLKRTSLLCGLAVLACGLQVTTANGVPATVTISNLNSTANIDPVSSRGMFDWILNGTSNYLNQQWFWYRVGSSGPAFPIDSISAPTVTQNPGFPDYASILYSNAQLSVEVRYSLIGGAPGSGESSIAEVLRILNNTQGSLPISFFQYSDFNLSPGGGQDTVVISNGFKAVQWNPQVGVSESFDLPTPAFVEVNTDHNTLMSVTNVSGYNLNNNAGPISGDVTWAVQWDVNIGPGGVFLISKGKDLHIQPPTPCTGSVCGFVKRDCNADGKLVGELGFLGLEVVLADTNCNIIATVLPDPDPLNHGAWCIYNIAPGTYKLYVTNAPGYNILKDYKVTSDPDKVKDAKTIITLTNCQQIAGLHFGFTGLKPAISLTKIGPATANCGDTITYTFIVTNTGNTCFYGGVKVSDPLFGGCIFKKTPVAVGEVIVFQTNYVVKTKDKTTLMNKATATGTPPIGSPVSACSTWVTQIITPCGTTQPPCTNPPPVTGFAGCEGKFWRNSGVVLWNGGSSSLAAIPYRPTDSFNTTFGVTSVQSGLPDSMTLLAALNIGSTKQRDLAKQATAGLLNSLAVNYPLSATTVILRYKVAVGAIACPPIPVGLTKCDTVSALDDELNKYNLLGSPLCKDD